MNGTVRSRVAKQPVARDGEQQGNGVSGFVYSFKSAIRNPPAGRAGPKSAIEHPL
jgi:hypothetical protein